MSKISLAQAVLIRNFLSRSVEMCEVFSIKASKLLQLNYYVRDQSGFQ